MIILIPYIMRQFENQLDHEKVTLLMGFRITLKLIITAQKEIRFCCMIEDLKEQPF